MNMKYLFTFTRTLSDPDSKIAFEVKSDILKFLAIATNGTFLKRMLKHQIYFNFVSQQVIDNPLFETFDEKFQQLVTGGLIDFYDRDYMEYTKPERYAHLQDEGPKVLTLQHLEAGFVVSFVPLVFAILAFVYEWITRIVDFFVFKYTLRKFYDMQATELRRRFCSNIKRVHSKLSN